MPHTPRHTCKSCVHPSKLTYDDLNDAYTQAVHRLNALELELHQRDVLRSALHHIPRVPDNGDARVEPTRAEQQRMLYEEAVRRGQITRVPDGVSGDAAARAKQREEALLALLDTY